MKNKCLKIVSFLLLISLRMQVEATPPIPRAAKKFQFIDRAGYKWEKLANGDEMKNKNVLISGSGIAGLTLAYWLKHYGFTPTLIEKHPTLRTGGYKIDIRGVAMEVVRRMGAYVPYLRRGPLSKAPQLWTVLASH